MEQDTVIQESDKAQVLASLLRHGAEDVESLARCTGWPEQIIRHTVLRLIVAGKVKCLHGAGKVRYALRETAPFLVQP